MYFKRYGELKTNALRVGTGIDFLDYTAKKIQTVPSMI